MVMAFSISYFGNLSVRPHALTIVEKFNLFDADLLMKKIRNIFFHAGYGHDPSVFEAHARPFDSQGPRMENETAINREKVGGGGERQ